MDKIRQLSNESRRESNLHSTRLDPGEDPQRHGEELAEHQALLAEKRTRLSRERTFSSWIRTALTLVVAGLGIAQLLDERIDARLATFIGVIFVLTGGGIFSVSFYRFWSIDGELQPARSATVLALSAVLVLGLTVSIALAVALILSAS